MSNILSPDRIRGIQIVGRVTLILVLLIASVLAWNSIWIYMERQDRLVTEQQRLRILTEPVQIINDSHLVSNVIQQDGSLAITFDTTRTEACRVLVDSFIIDAMTGTVLRSTQTPAAIQQAGEHLKATVRITLPPHMEPGNYIFRAIIYNTDCQGTGRSFTVTVPQKPFEVVASPPT
jgi:hypothetical protein